MDRLTANPSLTMRVALACAGLLLTGTVACHNAARQNPLDPDLTPGVELVSLSSDSLQGTAALVWTRYEGGQDFGEYRVDRRLAGQTAGDTRAVIEDVTDTSFTDSGLEGDNTYVYAVSVVNAAGLVVESNQVEVFVPFEAARILSAEFDSETASATLTWHRAGSGFDSYEIRRRSPGESRTLIVARVTAVAETTYTDTGLDGNTSYAYAVTTRSTSGRELASAEASGCFHSLKGEWQWDLPAAGVMKGTALDPDDRLYVGIGGSADFLDPSPRIDQPDRIYQFTLAGHLVNEFAALSDSLRFQVADLAADGNGVYLLMREIQGFSPSLGEFASYVDAFDPQGNWKYRWPANGPIANLGAIAVSPEGQLWAAQAMGPAATVHILDSGTGQVTRRLQLPGVALLPFRRSSMSVGDEVAAIEASYGNEPLVIVDRATGVIQPHRFAGEVAANFIICDLLLVPDGRLFARYFDPPRVEVLREWRHLTGWDLAEVGEPGAFPAAVELSAGGQLLMIEVSPLAPTLWTRAYEL
ncbi:MAG: fibronectin type III domain-containing protein [Gemmatimonadota bacterium]